MSYKKHTESALRRPMEFASIVSLYTPEYLESLLNHRHIRQQATKFIADLEDWDIFAHFTFGDRYVSNAKAFEQFSSIGFQLAREKLNSHIRIAWAYGFQATGKIHFHALYSPIGEHKRELTPDDFDGIEMPGRTLIEPARSCSTAAGYLAKPGHTWSINTLCDRSLPCRRKQDCLHDAGPWPTAGEIEAI
ncbi:MAG: hypothetical protein GY847_08145 [Proteobacteria bacterium]|nr:hypothetical protein [Pseudomonadota bacterium]